MAERCNDRFFAMRLKEVRTAGVRLLLDCRGPSDTGDREVTRLVKLALPERLVVGLHRYQLARAER
jgi:hypothetical protein